MLLVFSDLFRFALCFLIKVNKREKNYFWLEDKSLAVTCKLNFPVFKKPLCKIVKESLDG